MTTITREAAASTIQRYWRHSRAGLDHLLKDGDQLARLPYSQFSKYCMYRFCMHLHRGIEIPLRQERLKEEVEIFVKMREEYQEGRIYPVCTKILGKGKIPAYKMVKHAELAGLKRPKDGFIRLSPLAEKQMEDITRSAPANKQELDELVQALYKDRDLAEWDEKRDFCNARAEATIDLLALSGIPRTCFSKQYFFVSGVQASKKLPSWEYHVAAAITLANGELYIIDPSLCKNKALTLDGWLAMQLKDAKSVSDDDIIDLCHLQPGFHVNDPDYDGSKHCFLFTTAPMVALTQLSGDRKMFALEELDETGRALELQNLAKARQESESFVPFLLG